MIKQRRKHPEPKKHHDHTGSAAATRLQKGQKTPVWLASAFVAAQSSVRRAASAAFARETENVTLEYQMAQVTGVTENCSETHLFHWLYAKVTQNELCSENHSFQFRKKLVVYLI